MKDAIETVLAYQREQFIKTHKSRIVKPLTIKHEKRHTVKTFKREPVYA